MHTTPPELPTSQPLKDNQRFLSFRYNVQPLANVNVFMPKALGDSVDLTALRHAEAGACLLGKFNTLPGKYCMVSWDVGRLAAQLASQLQPAALHRNLRVRSKDKLPRLGRDRSQGPGLHHPEEAQVCVPRHRCAGEGPRLQAGLRRWSKQRVQAAIDWSGQSRGLLGLSSAPVRACVRAQL